MRKLKLAFIIFTLIVPLSVTSKPHCLLVANRIWNSLETHSLKINTTTNEHIISEV